MTDIVFLHGANHGSWCWAPLLEELRKPPAFQGGLITLDMPGCGTKRGRSVADLTVQAIARELNDDVRAASADHPVLVGHSIAGVLLPAMVLQDPSLYSAVIHLASLAPAEGSTVLQTHGHSRRGENPDEIGNIADPATTPMDTLFRMLFCPDLNEAQAEWLLREIMQDTTPPALMTEPVTRSGYEKLGIRTGYILAGRDPVVPPDWQRRFAARHGASTVIEIDTPHEPFASHPALLAETLRALIHH